MNKIIAICSLLHEPAAANSATRLFRNQPVLDWTITRLSRASSIDSAVILCWDDQLSATRPIGLSHDVRIETKGARQQIPTLQAMTTARRWSDGWRGGLLGSCEFDLGFHAPSIADIAKANDADAAILIDPASGLVDPVMIDSLVDHARAQPTAELCFHQVPPGFTGALLRRELIDRLAIAKIHPGRLLTYWPDQHGVDPIGKPGCAPVATAVARSIHRCKLDSHRQLARLARATVSLNGHLISSEAEELTHRMVGCESADILPRDVVMEINTARATKPIFWPGHHFPIDRSDLSLDAAEKLFAELNSLDDIRLTLAGIGDPLLSPLIFQIIQAARSVGIASINVETDLLTKDPNMIARLAESGADVVSVHLPAATAKTYSAIMGIDGFGQVMENIRLLEQAVNNLAQGTPLIVPIFTKTPENLAEMEVGYDYWIRRLGHAVILGPSDFAGQIPDTAVADMTPPKRKPCNRLSSRMMVLCNGQIVSCEQDVLGKQLMGTLGETPIKEIWQQRFGNLRACHQKSEWATKPLCASCREWHRP